MHPADEPPFDCDYRHPGRPGERARADWALIGEAGDYYVCDWHFQQRTDEGKRGWTGITVPTSTREHAGTTTEHEVASPTPPGQPTDPAE